MRTIYLDVLGNNVKYHWSKSVKVGKGQEAAQLRKECVARKTTRNGVICGEFMQTRQHFDIMHIQSAKTKTEDIAIDFHDHPRIGTWYR